MISDLQAVRRWIDRKKQPRTLGYGRLLMMVEDLKHSIAIYIDQLGFTVRLVKPLSDGRPFTALHREIALVCGRGACDRQIDHIAFEASDVLGLRDRLKRVGAHFQEDTCTMAYGLTIYVSDSDGPRVELYESPARPETPSCDCPARGAESGVGEAGRSAYARSDLTALPPRCWTQWLRPPRP